MTPPGFQRATEDLTGHQQRDAAKATLSPSVLESPAEAPEGALVTVAEAAEPSAYFFLPVQRQQPTVPAATGSPTSNLPGVLSSRVVDTGQASSSSSDPAKHRSGAASPDSLLGAQQIGLGLLRPAVSSAMPKVLADKSLNLAVPGSPGRSSNGTKKPADPQGPADVAGGVEADATTETIAAREAAACASSALALGHPIVSDSGAHRLPRHGKL